MPNAAHRTTTLNGDHRMQRNVERAARTFLVCTLSSEMWRDADNHKIWAEEDIDIILAYK